MLGSIQEMVCNYEIAIGPFVQLCQEEESFDVSFQKGFHWIESWPGI